ncbi:MAG: VOC family protein [Solirubrobacterales bacterium]|nr:VOC family protein [Solirubrobacterales bacterium]
MPIAHLGHAELLVSDLDSSRDFFTRVLGLYVSDETDDQVYLRAWQDWEHHTLVLTQATESALGHTAWRVAGPDQLSEYERLLTAAGVECHWVEGGSELGQGDGLRFSSPAGIPHELYWEAARHVETDPALSSRLPSHPTRFGSTGVAPRRFDHINFLVDDALAEQQWTTDVLGIRHNYYLENEDNTRLGSWLSSNNLSHEIAIMRNRGPNGSALHHVAYFVDSPDQVVRAATILAENEIRIEWGPGTHGTSGAIFLYFLEPSGHRVEVWTGGFLLFAPDWEPIRWDRSVFQLGLDLWGSTPPESFMTRGTPFAAPALADRPA